MLATDEAVGLIEAHDDELGRVEQPVVLVGQASGVATFDVADVLTRRDVVLR